MDLKYNGNPSISIHAPRAGCDLALMVTLSVKYKFQSTHPGRGATKIRSVENEVSVDFNPRTPGGVRLIYLGTIITLIVFQSTHPGRGATGYVCCLGVLFCNFNPRTPGGVRHCAHGIGH